jgi:arginyl-tRNA synthetase
MEETKEKIYSVLEKIAADLGTSEVNFLVEKPKVSGHGDFSANIALVLFKSRGPASNSAEADTKIFSLPAQDSKKLNLKFEGSNESNENFVSPRAVSPLELAEEIVEILNSKFLIHNSDFDKVEAVAPGFINFYLSPKYLQNQVQSIIEKGDSYGSLNIGQGKKASVEFVSANPTGPLHIGNARGGPLGDSIANVLQKQDTVSRENISITMSVDKSKDWGSRFILKFTPTKKVRITRFNIREAISRSWRKQLKSDWRRTRKKI